MLNFYGRGHFLFVRLVWEVLRVSWGGTLSGVVGVVTGRLLVTAVRLQGGVLLEIGEFNGAFCGSGFTHDTAPKLDTGLGLRISLLALLSLFRIFLGDINQGDWSRRTYSVTGSSFLGTGHLGILFVWTLLLIPVP